MTRWFNPLLRPSAQSAGDGLRLAPGARDREEIVTDACACLLGEQRREEDQPFLQVCGGGRSVLDVVVRHRLVQQRLSDLLRLLVRQRAGTLAGLRRQAGGEHAAALRLGGRARPVGWQLQQVVAVVVAGQLSLPVVQVRLQRCRLQALLLPQAVVGVLDRQRRQLRRLAGVQGGAGTPLPGWTLGGRAWLAWHLLFALVFLACVVAAANGRGFEGRTPTAAEAAKTVEEFASGWLTPLMFAAREGDPLWALVFSRAASAGVAGALAIGRFGRASYPWRLVASAGAFDVGGNALYVVARGLMPIGLAAALTGLYPIVTMLLARFLIGEHLPRMGQLGVALALLGIVLISVG